VTPDLIKALAQFQGNVQTAPKDVSDTRFPHASLESITKTVAQGACFGLSHAFLTRPSMLIDDVPQTEVTCFLYHEGGGYIQSSLIVADYSAKSGQSRDQQRGSSLTYAQRYLLAMTYGIAPGGDQGEPDKEIELQQKSVVKPTKRISPTQSEKPAEGDSTLIVPSFKDSLVVRIAPMEEAERNELMLEFKKQFSIRCNETRSNPKGIPSREHITLQEHGDWFDIKLRERAERLKREIKEQ
jgi:hypothetical protein